jgi:hypothetical protein
MVFLFFLEKKVFCFFCFFNEKNHTIVRCTDVLNNISAVSLFLNQFCFSIVAFSIERYIAVCHTMLAQKICTIRRAKRITVAVWIFCFLYCCPWLGLTETKPFAGFPDLESCNFRLSREQYVYYFIVDITLFYFLPLIMAVYVYVKIAQVLRSNNRLNLTEEGKSSRCQTDCASVVRLSSLKNSASPVDGSTGTEETCGLRSVRRMRLDNANNTQVPIEKKTKIR